MIEIAAPYAVIDVETTGIATGWKSGSSWLPLYRKGTNR